MRTFALFIAVAASGCAHQYGGRATVLERGKGQLTPSVEFSLLSARSGRDSSNGVPWLQGAMGYHQGIGARLEVGIRAFGFGWPNVGGEAGGAADVKLQLFRSDDRERGWDLALGLSGSYHFVMQGDQPFHVVGFAMPLLLGKNLGPHQLVFGLRVADWVLSSYGQNPQNAFFVGTSIGIALRVRRVEFMPELGILYSPVKWNGEQNDPDRTGLTILTLGLSLPIEVTPDHSP